MSVRNYKIEIFPGGPKAKTALPVQGGPGFDPWTGS